MSGRMRAALLALAAALLPVAMVSLVPLTADASPASPEASDGTSTVGTGASSDADSGDLGPLSQTKTLTRDYFDQDGTPASASNTVTVKIDKHADVQNDERIKVSWSGARPTGGRTVNPFGSGGMDQEYPVLLMECRGDAATVTPQTCWTSTFDQRTQSAPLDPTADQAVWLDDVNNGDADGQQISGLTDDQAANLPDECKFDGQTAAHITPFVGADGKVFYSCNSNDMAPEASQTSVTPPNEVSAFTDGNGEGTIEFQIRTDLENESLGCSQNVPCSLVVIPIEGISCKSATEQNCNKTGYYAPGQAYDGVTDADLAVSPKLWWSPSNWNNRFVFPLSMAPPPSVCSLTTTAGKPVPFYGSELLSQAALQWTPAYCLNPKRFNWQDNVTSDDNAFTQMQMGSAVAAEVSGRRDGDTGIAYAPTAVTSWGIAFDIDRPDGTQLGSLKLNARLLAKLLTESYPGGAIGAERPGLEDNPYSINLDPEFQQLNPGLDVRHASEAAATLLALSTSSDVMKSLTSYIASDADAMAFIHGKPDPWGMRINPAYKNISLPVSTWPLLDQWRPENAGSDCLQNNKVPYLQQIAEPVSSLRLISRALLYNWPNVNTVCTYDTGTGVYTIGRVPQQGIGNRFMLGLIDLGDAARSGLTVASLQAAHGHYVSADNAGMAAAVRLARPGGSLKPFTLSQDAVSRSSTAYPGTMVVYTAAKTYGLAQASADDVAQFIRISSTEGQTPGRGNGQLPQGYLPITQSGVTAPLWSAAQDAAAAIAAQRTPVSGPSSGPGTPSGPNGGTGGTDDGTTPPTGSLPNGAPGAGAPSSPAAPSQGPTTTTAVATVPTAAITSSVGGSLLPLLLVLGIAAGLATAGGRVWLRAKGLK